MSTAGQRKRISQLRMVAQRLVGEPWDTPLDAVRGMLCCQGQDWRGVQQSIALRTCSRSLAEVQDAFDDLLLVRTWPQRGTLHVLAAEDLRWYLAVAARHNAVNLRARGQQTIDPETLARVRTDLFNRLDAGRMSREELTDAWIADGTAHDRPRANYFLYTFCIEGSVALGPVAPRGTQEVVRVDALNDHVSYEDATLELARRYFASHGPASEADLAWWSPLTRRDIRRAMEELRDELEGIVVDGQTYWVTRDVLERADSLGGLLSRSVLALPAFDELILGYGSRWMTVPDKYAEELVPKNMGIFRNSIVSSGAVVGRWSRKARGPEITPFGEWTDAMWGRASRACARLP